MTSPKHWLPQPHACLALCSLSNPRTNTLLSGTKLMHQKHLSPLSRSSTAS